MQKVNIARALYRNCEVLLLDEVTEGLDPESEIHILNALKRRSEKNVMVVCISHKVEVLKAAHIVIYMKEGYIQGMEPHDKLCNEDGDYQKLIGNCLQ